MKVRALTSFSLGGGHDVFSGEVFEIAEPVARAKVRQGWVEPVEQDAPPAEPDKPQHPEAVPGVITTQDPPTIPNRDPRQTTRRR